MENLITQKIPNDLIIKTERLTVTAIREQDKSAYYKLYTDQSINEWWGYDYAEDLGDSPTEQDFFDLQNSLKTTEGEYAFAVRLQGEMIGELVLYNPTENSVEIGFRFFNEYHGKGYASESATALMNYVKNTLGAKSLKGRCFKQNAPSKALFLRLGFTVFEEDDTHYYFKLKD